MKSIGIYRDFTYRAKHNVHIQYVGGWVYHRVPEAAVRAILAAKAGEIIRDEPTIDA